MLRFFVLGGALASALASAGSATPRIVADPPPPAAFASVRLYPLPLQALNQCRLAAQLRLCPRRLPRASLAHWGAPRGTPPPLVVAERYGPYRDGHALLVGVSFGYGAPWEPGSGPDWQQHLWRNRPCCFLHFELYRALKGKPPMPAGVDHAQLGGRSGLLAPAGGYGLACGGPFFCNHLRFYWREHGGWYVATLHYFGARQTRALLDRLVRELQSVRTLQAGPLHVAATIRVGGFPNALAVGDGTVWVVGGGRRGGQIVRINQRSSQVAIRIRAPVGSERSCGIAIAGGSVWVAAHGPAGRETVLRIDPKRGRIVGRVPVPNAACVTAAAGAVWVSSPESRTLTRIDPKTGDIVARIPRTGSYPEGITYGYGSLWVASGARPCGSPSRPCTPDLDTSGQLTRLDPRANRVIARVRLAASPAYVATAGANVWISSNDGTIRRIEPRTNRPAGPPLPVTGGGRTTLAAGLGSLWVTSISGPGAPGTITPIDPRRQPRRPPAHRRPKPEGCQNPGSVHAAARWYSCMSPPSWSRRWIGPRIVGLGALIGPGVRSASPRCGRSRL